MDKFKMYFEKLASEPKERKKDVRPRTDRCSRSGHARRNSPSLPVRPKLQHN